jgi:hypothetical protein
MKVKFKNIKYTDIFERDQILTVKDELHYSWHSCFTFQEVEGEYSTIFFDNYEHFCDR